MTSLRILLLTLFLPVLLPAVSTISGFVYDQENGESLIGANIYLEGTASGASSNRNGYYVIPDVEPGQYILICQYIGYRIFKQKITVARDEDLRVNITMEPAYIEAEEIVIVADSLRPAERLFNRPISQMGISPWEIRQIPQVAESDLMRTLQTLPGILPVSDYSSQLYIRGGTPDQNLFLIDGADVYNPEHAFGLFSTFNTDAIKDVEVSKGGFGARFGGRLSSVIDVTNLDGNRKTMEGTAEISLLSAKGTIQLPLWNLGSLSASLRRTYLDQTFGRYIDDVPDYYFYDGHVKAFFDLSPRNKLSVSTFYGRDVLNILFDEDAEDSEALIYNWGNTTGSARWTYIFNPRLFSNFWVTYSRFSSRFDFEDIYEDNYITDFAIKGQFEYALSKKLLAEFGYEYKDLIYKYKQVFPGGIIDVGRDRDHYIAYVLLNWRPTARWEIESGVRYNYFHSNVDYQNAAPRFSAKYRLDETSSVKLATGVYHQYLHRIPRAFIADIWTTADENYQNSSAYHYIVGYQREVAGNLEFEAETYYKQYRDIYSIKDYILDLQPQSYSDEGSPIYQKTTGLFDRGDGYSVGLELFLRKNYGPLTGWIAYALSRTQYAIDAVNRNQSFAPRHDRTSVLNTVINMELKNFIRDLRQRPLKEDRGKWLLGMNFVYATGQPLTLTSSTYKMSSFPDRDFEELFLYPSARNEFRLPPYLRLDVSLTYERRYKSWMLSPYFQFFNIGNRKNVWFIRYEDEEDVDNNRVNQTIETVNMLPLLPTLGIRVKF